MSDGSDYPKTKPYRPSNGTEGMMFTERFCDRCKRDARYRETDDGADGCPILAASYCYEVDSEKYPKEWIVNLHDAIGSTARCTAFEHDPAADMSER
jgi:hypothetical protein